MRCVLLFMALMTNVFMFAQSEICNLDTQYITLLQQKKMVKQKLYLERMKKRLLPNMETLILHMESF